MVTHLKEAYDIANLKRAWRWLNTNSDPQFKGYFRNIYQAYGIAIDANLADLHNRLVKNEFYPQHATKLYLPKRSGVQRTYTLLTVEDQIVYQALVNVIAERMLPRTKKHSFVVTFGNVYAGKTSKYFYKDWRKGYSKFGQAVRKVYKASYTFTASFDLTACYDSIDHHVLSHFLKELHLQEEFIQALCKYLRHWTATMAENRIYTGHGIPQGPLASGLLSEVVLKYFDECRTVKPKSWHYFRYVDDIRFFAKNEHDLRAMLVQMDLLSKQIGLFPQSSKIKIHPILDIDKEIKSISQPREPISLASAPDQKKVHKRLIELTAGFKIEDDDQTRFKYVLGVADPKTPMSRRLIRILKTHPHLYLSIFRYFGKYQEIPADLSTELLTVIGQNPLYDAFTAEGLRTMLGRCHFTINADLEKLALSLIRPTSSSNGELLAAAYGIRLRGNKLKYQEILTVISEADEWWTRAELLRHIDITHIGNPSYETLMNHFIQDDSSDVSVVAASLILEHSLSVTVPIDKINLNAQNLLKESEVIGVRRGRHCPISITMEALLGPTVASIKWQKLLVNYYAPTRKKAARLKSYSESDATAWVGMLDAVHDNMLECLFLHDRTIGSYGKNIGGVLYQPTSAFATKYPLTYKAFRRFHDMRLTSDVNHSRIGKTKRPSTYVKFKFIEQIKPALRKAYLELWNLW